jgi:hypothetical protein
VHDESLVWEDKRNIQIVVVIEEEEENLMGSLFSSSLTSTGTAPAAAQV